MSLKILIVEDENAIALLIRSLIDYERLDVEVCGIALNGEQALSMIREQAPQIVITDISMPLMTGIDMISAAKEQGLKAHFIIISGLTQFSYAVSAIDLGVEGYLLKPVNREELNDLLEKVVTKIEKRSQTERQIRFLKKNSRLQLRTKRRSFLMRQLYQKAAGTGNPETEYDTDYVNREYGFHFQENANFLIGLICLDYTKQINYSARTSLIDSLIQRFDTEMKKHTIDCEEYNSGNGVLFLLNYSTEQPLFPFGPLSALQSELTASIGGADTAALTIACGIPGTSLSSVPYSLQTALSVLQTRVMAGTGRVLMAADLLTKKKCTYTLADSDLERLRTSIELKNREQLTEDLKQIFIAAAQGCKSCPHLLQEVYAELFSEIVNYLRRYGLIGDNFRHLNLTYQETINQKFRLTDIISFSVKQILSLLPEDHTDNVPEAQLASYAKSYINDHLSENIRLEDVAAQFYFSPSYFGTVFKEKTGESFSSYLTTARISRAKELLCKRDYTIDMVAAEVGFNDRRYFTKTFKKEVGVTPKEYRKVYLT